MISAAFDLGTTYSRIGIVNSFGVPVLIPDASDSDQLLTKSCLVITPNGCRVGYKAEQLLADEPSLPLMRHIAANLGRQEILPSTRREGGLVPETILALIVKKLMGDAWAFLGQRIQNAVFVIPAHFTETQRRSMRTAGALAGIEKICLVEKPASAAIYHGLCTTTREKRLFSYDFGGGTFKSSVLSVSPQGVSVQSAAWDDGIGGTLIDRRIKEVAVAEAPAGCRNLLESDSAACRQLEKLGESAKISLGSDGSRRIRKPVFVAGQLIDFLITSHQLEKLVSPVIDQTLEIANSCLADAGLSRADIDTIMLTGGMAFMPWVRDRVASFFEATEDKMKIAHPNCAATFGAALLASGIDWDRPLPIPDHVCRTSSTDLGILVKGPTGGTTAELLIQRGLPVPVERTKVYYYRADMRPGFAIEVVQSLGKSSTPQSIGKFTFAPVDFPQEHHPIEITLGYDHEGFILIKAKDGVGGRPLPLVQDSRPGLRGPDFLSQFDLVRNLEIV